MYSTERETLTRQELVKNKLRQKGDFKKMNGHIGKLAINLTSRNVEKTTQDALLARKRKFGSDSKNVYEFDPESEKEYEDLPILFDSPSSKRKTPNLRAFSNENSRFVKNIPNKKAYEISSDNNKPSTSRDHRASTTLCSFMPTTFTTSNELASCATTDTPFGKFDNVIERNERTNHLEPWVKRKFYVVENAGRPTEIFCTDFIHKVKQEMPYRNWQNMNRQPDSNSTQLKIMDKWREEWSGNGVQMAIGSNKESYHFETSVMFPQLSETKSIELPKKLISINSTKYTKEYSKDFQHSARNSLCYYLKDGCDDEWMENEKASGHNISADTFVKIMNLFEVTAYRKIHDALLEPLRTFRGSSEEDAECMICQLPEWELGDNIVFCDGCNIAVHQSCYGIPTLPVNEWFCQLCSHFGAKTPHQQSCLFCPVKGGPMKATKHMESWAHVACALWLPEVRFGDVETRQPITHVNDVPAEKWQARCSICDTHKGACIECIHSKCTATFHIGCAISSGDFLLNIENDDKNNNGVKMVRLCDKHACPYKDKRVRRVNEKKKLPDMIKNFSKFVNLNEVAEQLGIPFIVVERVHSYWISKRISRNCQPLISEPEVNDLISTLNHKQSELTKRKRNTSRQKNIAAASLQYDPIPKEELLQSYEGIRMMRLDLENARNLSYMVKQREKLKKSKFECCEEQVKTIGNVLFCEQPLFPVSKRKLDKLLLEWKEAVL